VKLAFATLKYLSVKWGSREMGVTAALRVERSATAKLL
jgi:hypothetical protein